MQNSFITLMPAILVLIMAIWSKNVILSLLTGIVSAALIATDFSPLGTISLISKRIFEESDLKNIIYGSDAPDHLYTFIFLILLGAIISLMTHTGGIQAYSNLLKSKLKSKKSVETTSLSLSSLFFLDDYLNSLTVGSIMRPLSDSYSIARVKLAYLLDSMSGPLCVLVPATSWVAFILTQIQNSGISQSNESNIYIYADPFEIYLKSIPYLFYPIMAIAGAWLIVRYKVSFGKMHQQELIAQTTGNLFGGKKEINLKIKKQENQKESILDFILPIAIFLTSFILLLLYTGNWSYLGGNLSLLKALQNSKSIISLLIASIISFILSTIVLIFHRKINFSDIILFLYSGFDLMKNSLILLLLAWTFGSLLKNDLQTGNYLSHVLLGTLPIYLIPLMTFITAITISATTGSAWGTIAIVTPLIIPLTIKIISTTTPITADQAYLIYPVIGAIISGAIAGGHISPISDSTVLSSTSAGTYPLDHFETQIEYVTPTIIGASVALLITGIFATQNQFLILPISFLVGLSISFSILLFKNKKQ